MWFMDNRPMCCAGLVLLLAGTGTGIDVKSTRAIFELSYHHLESWLHELQYDHAILMATHDLPQAAGLSDARQFLDCSNTAKWIACSPVPSGPRRNAT
ncbi:MAG TPA: hypothetical protein VFK46_01255 [Candidatus Macondimonas sp.]|nr:hypothetical protein [Candidatus Macondimonas sp.]